MRSRTPRRPGRTAPRGRSEQFRGRPWQAAFLPAVRAGPSGLTAEQCGEQRHRAALVEWVVLVPTLGRLYARRASIRAITVCNRLTCRGQPFARRGVPVFGEAGPAGVAVVHEDGEAAGVGVA